jgi:hypothetical protein
MKKRASARVRVSTRDRRRSGGQTRSGSIGLTPLFQKSLLRQGRCSWPGVLRLGVYFFRAPPRKAAITNSGTTHSRKCSSLAVRAAEVTGDNNLVNEALGESFRLVISKQLKEMLIR